MPGLIHLVGVRRDVLLDLGQQRDGEHPPGTLPHDLIQRRGHPRDGVLNYPEHGRAFPTSARNAGLDQKWLPADHPSGRHVPPEPDPQVLIIAPAGLVRSPWGRCHPLTRPPVPRRQRFTRTPRGLGRMTAMPHQTLRPHPHPHHRRRPRRCDGVPALVHDRHAPWRPLRCARQRSLGCSQRSDEDVVPRSKPMIW